MNGSDFNKGKKGNINSSSKIQSNHGRAEIRKVDSGFNVSFKRGDVAGTKALVYLSDLQASSSYSMANVKVNYEESERMEDQRDRAELYQIRSYYCA